MSKLNFEENIFVKTVQRAREEVRTHLSVFGKAGLQATGEKFPSRWIIKQSRMVWQWTQLSREELRGLQLVCWMNSTTRPEGPNNWETHRNTHCCSDCHILQIINCQGSCPPPPFTILFFFLYRLLSLSASSWWCGRAWSAPHYLLAHINSVYPWAIGYRTEQGKQAGWEEDEEGEWIEVELIFWQVLDTGWGV